MNCTPDVEEYKPCTVNLQLDSASSILIVYLASSSRTQSEKIRKCLHPSQCGTIRSDVSKGFPFFIQVAARSGLETSHSSVIVSFSMTVESCNGVKNPAGSSGMKII